MVEASTKSTILIVEDEPSLRLALSSKFAGEGFAVSEAPDGAVGLTRAIEEKPSIILLDILMPIMDGLTMLKKLRVDSTYGKDVPVIVLTNVNDDTDIINTAVTETSPTFFLVKTNWTIQDVVEKVTEIVTPQ